MPKCDRPKYGEVLEDMTDKISKGFDRDVDFEPMKQKLITDFNNKLTELKNFKESEARHKAERRFLVNKINYIFIAIIQLRNGSRISEACLTYRKFMAEHDLTEPVIVKIAKSEKTGINKNGEEYTTKARYRKMVYPDWISEEDFKFLKKDKDSKKLQECKSLKKRTLDYLRITYQCNTHSLRYAFINYMLNVKKLEMNTVAKIVGHINLNMLVKYTQNKNIDKVLCGDI